MEQEAGDIFEKIGKAIQFDAKKRDNVIPFEFLGVVKDYNGVDIKQTKDYIEMSCANYIQRLSKSYGWDKDSSKSLPLETLSVPVSNSDAATVEASDGVVTENVCIDSAAVVHSNNAQPNFFTSKNSHMTRPKNEKDIGKNSHMTRPKIEKDTHNFHQKLINPNKEIESDKKTAHNFHQKLIKSSTKSSVVDPYIETLDDSKSKINTNVHPVLHKPEQQVSMKSNRPLAPLPSD